MSNTKALVAVLGPHPMPYGTKGRTTRDDMAEMAKAAGVDLVCISDEMPSDADKGTTVTTMRNRAAEKALEGAYGHVLILENDARVPVGMLGQLLAHGKDVIVPRPRYISFPDISKQCTSPQPVPDSPNPFPISWSAVSAVLLSRKVLETTSPWTFGNHYGEGMTFKTWRHQIGTTYMALDSTVDVLRIPGGLVQLAWEPLEEHGTPRCGGRIQIYAAVGTTRIGICQVCNERVSYHLEDALNLPLPEGYE